MTTLTPENLVSSVAPSMSGMELDIYTAMVGVLALVLVLVGVDYVLAVLWPSRGEGNTPSKLSIRKGDKDVS